MGIDKMCFERNRNIAVRPGKTKTILENDTFRSRRFRNGRETGKKIWTWKDKKNTWNTLLKRTPVDVENSFILDTEQLADSSRSFSFLLLERATNSIAKQSKYWTSMWPTIYVF